MLLGAFVYNIYICPDFSFIFLLNKLDTTFPRECGKVNVICMG